jgi:cyclase
MNTKLIACYLLISFIALTNPTLAQNFDTVQIKINKITASVYSLEGSGGNIGVLTGQDGIILIDDQFAPLTEKIKKALATISEATKILAEKAPLL